MRVTLRNVEKINQLVYENHQRTINDTADVVGKLYRSMQAILTSELNMWCVTIKLVLHLLTTEQKEHCASLSRSLLACRWWPILHVDEYLQWWDLGLQVWLRQSRSQHSRRALHLHDQAAAWSRVCSFFFSTSTVLCIKNSPPSARPPIYCNVLKHLWEDVQQKWPHVWSTKDWILQNDNAPCHQAFITGDFLAKSNASSSTDFHLFPKLKMQHKVAGRLGPVYCCIRWLLQNGWS